MLPYLFPRFIQSLIYHERLTTKRMICSLIMQRKRQTAESPNTKHSYFVCLFSCIFWKDSRKHTKRYEGCNHSGVNLFPEHKTERVCKTNKCRAERLPKYVHCVRVSATEQNIFLAATLFLNEFLLYFSIPYHVNISLSTPENLN